MAKGFRTRKRYRLTFVNENTFNAVWSVKLSRAKVWVLSAVCCAAIAALAVTLFVWSPLKTWLPGYIKPAERRLIVENTLRMDSLLALTEMQQRYADNLRRILTDEDPDTLPAAAASVSVGDTLLAATDNERAFVESWMERERGNLSVLTPIVAEGMTFRLPASGARLLDDGSGLQAPNGATVQAIQEATVVGSSVDPLTGRTSLTLQHSNDFISIYGGLRAPFVSVGQRVSAGQALGTLGPDGRLGLSVWHHGRRTPLSGLLPL